METITLEYFDSNNNEDKSLSFSSHLLQEKFKPESLFVSQVQGQSMQPKIMDKSLVVADLSQKEIIQDGIYLLNYDNNMWIKQANFNTQKKSFEFISLNPKFSHLVYDENEVYLIAKVLLTFTKL